MAHGELMMIGAYTTYMVQTAMPNHIGISIIVAIPAAFLVWSLIGVLMERCIVRFLYGRPLETLLATFGVSLILQQAVRSIFSALNRSVVTPDWLSGSLRINDALAITNNRLYIVLFTLLVFSLVVLALKRTRIGLNIRAVSQNRAMAKAHGHPHRMGGRHHVRSGLRHCRESLESRSASFTNVGPNLGQSYIIDSFVVVVFGGVGNLWGSLIGGAIHGDRPISCWNLTPARCSPKSFCWSRSSSSFRPARVDCSHRPAAPPRTNNGLSSLVSESIPRSG